MAVYNQILAAATYSENYVPQYSSTFCRILLHLAVYQDIHWVLVTALGVTCLISRVSLLYTYTLGILVKRYLQYQNSLIRGKYYIIPVFYLVLGTAIVSASGY